MCLVDICRSTVLMCGLSSALTAGPYLSPIFIKQSSPHYKSLIIFCLLSTILNQSTTSKMLRGKVMFVNRNMFNYDSRTKTEYGLMCF